MADASDKERFIRAMRDWGVCYADWAGGDRVWAEDDEVVGKALYPGSGDWIVYDARGAEGFLGAPHDEWAAVRPITLKPGVANHIDRTRPTIDRATRTSELMRRYVWIANVFISWLHVDGGSPYDIWTTREAIDAAYDAEAACFADDPWLATYWLVHFGLTNDPRYADVARAARANKFDQTHNHARWSLAFFDATDLSFDMDLAPPPSARRQGDDFTGLFLRRRANLLYLTYSQSYRGGGEPVDALWSSASLFRRYDRFAIRRMRWLRNNLEKHNLWDALGPRLNAPENDDIPYIAYARAMQPNHPGAGAAADALVAELITRPEGWKSWNANWAKILMWDIRTRVGDRTALKAAAEVVFEGDRGHEQYGDILTAVGETPPGGAAARAALTAFEALFESVRDFRMAPPETKATLRDQADALLSEQSEATLSFFVDAAQSRDAVRLLWRHLLLGGPSSREDLLARLTPRVAIGDYDLKHFFDSERPTLFSDAEDPAYRALLRAFTAPATAFASDKARKDRLRTVATLLSAAAHQPGVYEELVALVEAAEPDESTDALFTRVFKKTFDKPIDPIMALDKPQVERLLTATVDYIRRHPDDSRDARSLIYYCANPHAIEWLTARLADADFFKAFEGYETSFDPLDVELKRDLEAALDWRNDKR